MPLQILAAVGNQESGFDPQAVSKSGAQGVMQLMPGTAKEMGVSDPFDPLQNIIGGAMYLRSLYAQFGSWPLALAAYNAGAGAVEEAGGRIPNIPETQQYVVDILSRLGGVP